MRTGTSSRFANRFAAVLAAALSTALLALPAAGKDPKSNPKTKPSEVGGVDGSGVYRMSEEELSYDCKRLTGRMQIRLLEVRSYDPSKKASELGRGIQSATQPMVGLLLGKASGHSADPDRRHADDIAMLKAYNAQLAAKKCKTYDLDKELGAGAKGALPTVQTPATKAPAAK